MLTSQNLGLSETVGEMGAAVCVDFLKVDQILNGIKMIKDHYPQYSQAAVAFYEKTSNFETMKEIVENL